MEGRSDFQTIGQWANILKCSVVSNNAISFTLILLFKVFHLLETAFKHFSSIIHTNSFHSKSGSSKLRKISLSFSKGRHAPLAVLKSLMLLLRSGCVSVMGSILNLCTYTHTHCQNEAMCVPINKALPRNLKAKSDVTNLGTFYFFSF